MSCPRDRFPKIPCDTRQSKDVLTDLLKARLTCEASDAFADLRRKLHSRPTSDENATQSENESAICPEPDRPQLCPISRKDVLQQHRVGQQQCHDTGRRVEQWQQQSRSRRQQASSTSKAVEKGLGDNRDIYLPAHMLTAENSVVVPAEPIDTPNVDLLSAFLDGFDQAPEPSLQRTIELGPPFEILDEPDERIDSTTES
jgi:hypothetical protein